MEQWRTIVGFEKYEVSDMGRVRHKHHKKIRALRTHNGYHYITLKKQTVKKTLTVHRLVAEAFLSGYNELLQVDHIDNNRSNNLISNLRMTTPKRNSRNRKAYKNRIREIIRLHNEGFTIDQICSALR